MAAIRTRASGLASNPDGGRVRTQKGVRANLWATVAGCRTRKGVRANLWRLVSADVFASAHADDDCHLGLCFIVEIIACRSFCCCRTAVVVSRLVAAKPSAAVNEKIVATIQMMNAAVARSLWLVHAKTATGSISHFTTSSATEKIAHV